MQDRVSYYNLCGKMELYQAVHAAPPARFAAWLTALLLAWLAMLAGTAPAPAATIIVNANGYSLDAAGRVERLRGLVIGDDGRILRVLRRGDAEPKAQPGDFRLDARGRTLLPGLIDAHGHVLALGEGLLHVDLSATRSLEEALEAVRAHAAANPARKWILGRGWNQVRWGLGRFPTAAELDRAVSDRPVALSRIDGHALWVNTAALKAGGVTAATRDPAGGRIERGPGGAPSGVLVDAAETLVTRHIPPATPGEQEAALAAALTLMARLGLTGVHDMGVTPEAWRLYRMFGDEGRLSVRVTGYAAGIEAMEAIAPLRPTPWLNEDRLRLVGVKLYADGALGSRGAWLKAPYSDDPGNRGLRFHDDTRLRNMVSRANFLGLQVALHAIGDAANAQALDAFAEVLPAYGQRLRNRIEHAQLLDPADIPRFAALGVVASVQPTHATSDKAMAGARVGEARLAGAYAWRALLDSGARMAFGSDFPVEPAEPLFGLHAAITRQDRDGQPPGGWRADQKVTRAEALAGFTSWAAWAGHAETRVGRLAPGFWADFVLLDGDPMDAPAEEIWRIGVVETWVGGRRVFQRDPAEAAGTPGAGPAATERAAPAAVPPPVP